MSVIVFVVAATMIAVCYCGSRKAEDLRREAVCIRVVSRAGSMDELARVTDARVTRYLMYHTLCIVGIVITPAVVYSAHFLL